jgi:hypothetical protein
VISLIRKDFYLLQRAMFTWIVAYSFFILINLSSASLRVVPVFMVFFLLASALAMDDRYNLEPLYCSLPLKRSTIVIARYVFSFLIVSTGLLLSWLASHVVPGQPISLRAIFFTFSAAAFFLAIFFPLNYRFGFRLENEPFKILGVLLTIAGVIFGLAMLILRADIKFSQICYLELYLVLILTGVVAFSILLSIAFFRRREW